jgi:DNA polymerase III epsilon subunit-like protein
VLLNLIPNVYKGCDLNHSTVMSYHAWDTETTGLPMSRQAATAENIHMFDTCRIVSLAFVTYSTEGEEMSCYNSLVYPDTFRVTATEIHGITHEHARTHGKPFEEVYNDFVTAVGHVNTLVAHNSNFDKNAFFSECYRRGLSVEPFVNTTFDCTLDLVKARYLKPMKLTILYKKLTGNELIGAHDALADARACGQVYSILRKTKRVIKPLGIRKVVLKASEVAAMIDKNRFKKPDEVMMDMWNKYSPETFKGKTKDQAALETIGGSVVATEVLNNAMLFKSTNSSSVEQKACDLKVHLTLEGGLEKSKLDAVNDYIRRTLFTNHGILHEENTANTAPGPKMDTDDTFYRYTVCTIEDTEYQIVGRIDRIISNEDGGLTIVEIKNRVHNLFNAVREYENIQCQTYMEMLNIDRCNLVEQYNTDMCTHLIMRSKSKWDTIILPKLKNFCECFHSLLSET